jgi:hypothetical protein
MINHYEVFGVTYVESQTEKWSELCYLIEKNARNFEKNTRLILIIDAVKSYDYYNNLIKSNPKHISILLIVEQPSVNPLQHKRKIRNLFDHVFVSSIELVEKYNGTYYTFPLSIKPFQEITKIRKDKKIVFGLIATSKNSLVDSSLYWLRPRVISFLSKKEQILFAGKDFHLKRLSNIRMDINYCYYLIKNGVKPNILRFRTRRLDYKQGSYLGELESKNSIFNKIDVYLCLENDIYEFSEKFIDAVSAGKLPLYVGPNLDQLGIPESVYIKGSTSLRELREILDSVDAELINSKLDNLADWRINGMNKWKQEVAFDELADKIISLTGSPSHPKT